MSTSRDVNVKRSKFGRVDGEKPEFIPRLPRGANICVAVLVALGLMSCEDVGERDEVIAPAEATLRTGLPEGASAPGIAPHEAPLEPPHASVTSLESVQDTGELNAPDDEEEEPPPSGDRSDSDPCSPRARRSSKGPRSRCLPPQPEDAVVFDPWALMAAQVAEMNAAGGKDSAASAGAAIE